MYMYLELLPLRLTLGGRKNVEIERQNVEPGRQEGEIERHEC